MLFFAVVTKCGRQEQFWNRTYGKHRGSDSIVENVWQAELEEVSLPHVSVYIWTDGADFLLTRYLPSKFWCLLYASLIMEGRLMEVILCPPASVSRSGVN